MKIVRHGCTLKMSVNMIVSEHISVKGSVVYIQKSELYHLFENCDKCPKETCLYILKLLEDRGVNYRFR